MTSTFLADSNEFPSDEDGYCSSLDGNDDEDGCWIVDDEPNGEDASQDWFLSELTNFIHTAKLNKTSTSSLLSLLRTTHSLEIKDIPKTTHSLWKKLRIEFAFDKFYYCSICFAELVNYHDICPTCKRTKHTTNSELCVFSLANEIQRVVRSNVDVISWYRSCKNRIPCDIVNGSIDQKIIAELRLCSLSFRRNLPETGDDGAFTESDSEHRWKALGEI